MRSFGQITFAYVFFKNRFCLLNVAGIIRNCTALQYFEIQVHQIVSAFRTQKQMYSATIKITMNLPVCLISWLQIWDFSFICRLLFYNSKPVDCCVLKIVASFKVKLAMRRAWKFRIAIQLCKMCIVNFHERTLFLQSYWTSEILWILQK